MKENNGTIVFTIVVALLITCCVWVLGYMEGLEAPCKEAIFEDYKELKIDTLLYNYRDSTYVTAS